MSEIKICKVDHDAELAIPRDLCRVCSPVVVTNQSIGATEGPQWVDPVEQRQRDLRASQLAAKEAKRKASLAKHLDNHKFETWDPKAKVWVRDQAKIDAHHKAMEEVQS